MISIIDKIEQINHTINSTVWGPPMIVLILLIGLYFTISLNFFQLTYIKNIINLTILKVFRNKKRHKNENQNEISQFQAISTALAATIGTGSIAGVATAITIGGAGAVFWMWVSAFVGMMTVYAENVLGIYYRNKDKNNNWKGGAMYYIQYGLNCKWLAVLFAIFCVGASFGMGNMVQANSVTTSLQETFKISPIVSGVILCVIITLIIIGGITRIGKVSEILVPFISIIYIVSCIIVIVANYSKLPMVLSDIFKGAFGINSVVGGVTGASIKIAISMGVKRGVFSNEAGLGSSVMVHSAANVKEPVVQGMWGIVEVFIDTIVVCSLTAFVILVAGVDKTTSFDGSVLVISAFEKTMGDFSAIIVTFFIVVFAFATIIGWQYIGEKAAEYIFGNKSVGLYKLLFIIFLFLGANMELKLVWDISDTLNGIMAIPNLIALILLSPVVIAVTKNYLERKNNQRRLKPLLSAHKEIQRLQEKIIE